MSGRYTIRVDVLDSNKYKAVSSFYYYIYSESLLPGDTVNLTTDLLSPQQDNVGTIALTSDVVNGTGSGLLYKFTVTNYLTKVVVPLGENLNSAGYQSATTVNWTPTESGRYILRVDVLDASNSYKAYKYFYYYIYSDSLLPGDTVNLTTDLLSPQQDNVGTIALTSDVVNGTGSGLLYKFTVTNYLTKVVVTLGENLNSAGYQSATTVNWTPTESGRYILRVDVLDASNSYKAYKYFYYYIYSDSLLPGDTVNLTTDLPSPQQDNVGAIALTADVVNGTGAGLRYKFTVTNYLTKVVLTLGENLDPAGYQNATTVNWTPTESGKYILRVDVLDASNGYKAYKYFYYYIYSESLLPGDTVNLTTDLPSPQPLTVGNIVLTADVFQGTGVGLLYKFTATNYVTKEVVNFGENLDAAGYQFDDTTASWTPTLFGRYTLRVDVLDPSNGYKASKTLIYYITIISGSNPVDGAAMVWVPGGIFTMGSINGVGSFLEHPAHQVTLSGFWMYKNEVTVAQYRAFCAATSRALPPWPGNQNSWAGKTGWTDATLQLHPIVNVNWNDAKAYADWAGVLLPTEAQWEYTARGVLGRNYPWGGTATATNPTNGWDETKCANYYNSYTSGKSTWPVGSFPAGASWCGAQDMAGNVWEWCADRFGYYSSTPVVNPTGPASGILRELRGGSYAHNNDNVRSAIRTVDEPTSSASVYGFRCVSVSPGP